MTYAEAVYSRPPSRMRLSRRERRRRVIVAKDVDVGSNLQRRRVSDVEEPI